MNGLTDFDYTRLTEPGPILVVRLPGIYADVAGTKNAIILPNEKVYVTVKRDAAMFELLTVDVATLEDGRSTRYRAELNVKLPGFENMTPEDEEERRLYQRPGHSLSR